MKQSKFAMKLVLIAFLIAIFNQEVSYGQFFGPSKFSSKACQVYICGIKCLRVVFAKNIKNLRSKRSFFYKVCDWKSGFFFLIFPSNIWPQLWKNYSFQFVYQLLYYIWIKVKSNLNIVNQFKLVINNAIKVDDAISIF